MKLNKQSLFSIANLRGLFSFVFLISFPFSTAINNIAFGLLMAISTYLLIRKKSKLQFTSLGYISIGVVVFLISDIVFFGSISQDIDNILRYFVLLISPMLFLGDKEFAVQFKKIYLFVYGIFFCIILYNLFQHYLEFNQFVLHKSSVNVGKSLFFERLYFGLFGTIAAIITCSLFKKAYMIKYIILISILLIDFMIATRLAFFMLILIIVSQVIIDSKFIFSKKILLPAVLLIIVFVSLASVNNGFKKRFFFQSTSFDDFVENFKINEPRYAIWKCARLISLENSDFDKTFGFSGNPELFSNLFQCYEEHVYIKEKRAWFLRDKLNTHNQFIHIFLLHGLIGLTLTIFMFTMFFVYKKDLISIYLLLTIIMFGMIEIFIFRQIGMYLIFICFSLLSNNGTSILHQSNNNLKEI